MNSNVEIWGLRCELLVVLLPSAFVPQIKMLKDDLKPDATRDEFISYTGLLSYN